jgi:hypothetical protein
MLLTYLLQTKSFMKNGVFWDVAPCRSCVNRRLEGTHLQDRKMRERETSTSRWLNPDCLGEKPVTNRLNYGTTMRNFYSFINSSTALCWALASSSVS